MYRDLEESTIKKVSLQENQKTSKLTTYFIKISDQRCHQYSDPKDKNFSHHIIETIKHKN